MGLHAAFMMGLYGVLYKKSYVLGYKETVKGKKLHFFHLDE
jgi:hypothetical protein